MTTARSILNDFTHIFFPHVCAGCGSDSLGSDAVICFRCMDALPLTNFQFCPDNPVEKIFWGRLPLQAAASLCYFTKNSLLQQLLHQLKYQNNKDLGHFLGRLLGRSLQSSGRFDMIDGLVALPLHASKEKKRGYNQATLICEGVSDITGIPVLMDAVKRLSATDTQTKKNRIQRWQNMEGRFSVNNAGSIAGKHLLLVDDIITTGATLEACGLELAKQPGLQLSIASIAYAATD